MVTEYTYEVVVTPKDGSTGENLVTILNALGMARHASLAVVVDVECNGNRSWVGRSPFRVTIEELVDYAKGVGQFDWGTFFFFRELPGVPTDMHDFDALFVAADLVVRAVDDTYFYVYSATTDDASNLAKFFDVESHERKRDTIVHPF